LQLVWLHQIKIASPGANKVYKWLSLLSEKAYMLMEPIIKCIHDQAFNQVLAEPSLKCMNKLLLNKKKGLK